MALHVLNLVGKKNKDRTKDIKVSPLSSPLHAKKLAFSICFFQVTHYFSLQPYRTYCFFKELAKGSQIIHQEFKRITSNCGINMVGSTHSKVQGHEKFEFCSFKDIPIYGFMTGFYEEKTCLLLTSLHGISQNVRIISLSVMVQELYSPN